MATKRGILDNLTEDERLEVHKLIYGMARNAWSLFLLLSELLTGERFNARDLKIMEFESKEDK